MNDRDERPIDKIPFAREGVTCAGDGSLPEEVVARQTKVRSILGSAGVEVVQDIIELGCTGLLHELGPAESALERARFVRANMGGSGIGLPCYVPSTRFCWVHNTIGGLQAGQRGLHPEGVALCSRELTPEERDHMAVMGAFVEQEGLKRAQEMGLGIEAEDEEMVKVTVDEPAQDTGTKSHLGPDFICPEHKERVWKCRYCLAAAVIHGPPEPILTMDEGWRSEVQGFSDSALEKSLRDAIGPSVFVRVVVAWFKRQLVEVKE